MYIVPAKTHTNTTLAHAQTFPWGRKDMMEVNHSCAGSYDDSAALFSELMKGRHFRPQHHLRPTLDQRNITKKAGQISLTTVLRRHYSVSLLCGPSFTQHQEFACLHDYGVNGSEVFWVGDMNAFQLIL